MDKIKKFEVSGVTYELDLESIGSYIGDTELKDYIDSHSGGSAERKIIALYNNLQSDDTLEAYNFASALDASGKTLAGMADKYIFTTYVGGTHTNNPLPCTLEFMGDLVVSFITPNYDFSFTIDSDGKVAEQYSMRLKTVNNQTPDYMGNINVEGGEPDAYLKTASVNGNTLTLTNKDDSTVSFTPTGGGSSKETVVLRGQTTDKYKEVYDYAYSLVTGATADLYPLLDKYQFTTDVYAAKRFYPLQYYIDFGNDDKLHIRLLAEKLDFLFTIDSNGQAFEQYYSRVLTINNQYADYNGNIDVIDDAPSDGKFYARKDGQWVDITDRLS